MKLLIIGGYGMFGGRLAHSLSDLDMDIYISGRNLSKAKAFCEVQTGTARYHPLELDRDDIAKALKTYNPTMVIDASGPFQAYGQGPHKAPYKVVRACIAAGAHYGDLADAARFVDGVSQFDDQAKAAGVFIISGLSTCLGLSGAVIADIAKEVDPVHIEIGIAPSPHVTLGQSVLRAALSYAGGEIDGWRDGQDVTLKGLTEYRRYTISPPGIKPLHNRHFSLAEFPDFTLLPRLYPRLKSVWGGAGIRPEWQHKGLNLLAHMRSVLRFPAPTFLAPIAQKMLKWFARGDHRGGMFVTVEGECEGKMLTRSWHLIAEGDDGPYIPTKACEVIVRKLHAGQGPNVGARTGLSAIELSEFQEVFARHKIVHGYRETRAQEPAFRKVLGDAFDALPESVKGLHAGQSGVWTGQAELKGPANFMGAFANLLAGIRMKSGPSPITFTLDCNGEREVWIRDFGGTKFQSVLKAGTGRNQYLMIERFGFLSVAMALVKKGDKLWFEPRKWYAFGLPMPKFLLPYGETKEFEAEGKFYFDVSLNVPFIGRLAHYRGWLKRSE